MNEVDFLRRRLAEEQANVQRANQAKQEAEARCRLAERERDIYKILARTLRARLNSSLPEGLTNNSDDIIEETAAEMILGGRQSFSTFGFGRMLRLAARERNDEEMGEDTNDDFEFEENDDDDDDSMSEAMDDSDDEDDSDDDDDDESLSVASDHQNLPIAADSTMSTGVRSQSRTVSITEGDL